MPTFTKFSAYDDDVNELIANLGELYRIALANNEQEVEDFKISLKEWIFSAGAVKFQQVFAKARGDRIREMEQQSNAERHFTLANVKDAKIVAYLAFKVALVEKLDTLVSARPDAFYSIFNDFLNKALNHQEYFAVTALATARVIQFHKDCKPHQVTLAQVNDEMSKVYNQQLNAATLAGNMALVNALNDHSTFSREWVEYSKSLTAPRSAASAPQQLFKPAVSTVEAKAPESRKESVAQFKQG